MIDVEFTSDELALVHHALSAFLSDFGHKQADVVHQLRDLMGRSPLRRRESHHLNHLPLWWDRSVPVSAMAARLSGPSQVEAADLRLSQLSEAAGPPSVPTL
jgi:hypothetical protein